MQQISAFAAKTSCRLIALPLEDILLIKEQVNVPGVTTEYPCWRQKLPLYIEDPVLDEHLQKVSPFSGKSH
jgi:4-alpha-glucanotransferase